MRRTPQQHRLGRAVARLVVQQRAPEVVEAIGLVGGAGTGADDGADTRVVRGEPRDDRDRRGIVRVAADIEPIVAGAEARDRSADHLRDDGGLVPGRNEDRDPAGRRGRREAIRMGTRIAAVDRGTAPKRPHGPDRVDRRLVDAADQEAERGEQRQFMERGAADGRDRNPVDHLRFPPKRMKTQTADSINCGKASG